MDFLQKVHVTFWRVYWSEGLGSDRIEIAARVCAQPPIRGYVKSLPLSVGRKLGGGRGGAELGARVGPREAASCGVEQVEERQGCVASWRQERSLAHPEWSPATFLRRGRLSAFLTRPRQKVWELGRGGAEIAGEGTG